MSGHRERQDSVDEGQFAPPREPPLPPPASALLMPLSAADMPAAAASAEQIAQCVARLVDAVVLRQHCRFVHWEATRSLAEARRVARPEELRALEQHCKTSKAGLRQAAEKIQGDQLLLNQLSQLLPAETRIDLGVDMARMMSADNTHRLLTVYYFEDIETAATDAEAAARARKATVELPEADRMIDSLATDLRETWTAANIAAAMRQHATGSSRA